MKQEVSNRDIILSCAKRLFFEKGYDTVGVQEIVDTAGITKPTMYYYFKSKQGLLECLLEEGAQQMIEGLERVLATEGQYEAVFRKVTEAYLEAAMEDKEFYLLLSSVFTSARDNEAFRLARPYISKLLELVKSLFGRYLPTEDEKQADYLAISYTGAINMFLMVAFERGELDDPEVRRNFLDQLCRHFQYVPGR